MQVKSSPRIVTILFANPPRIRWQTMNTGKWWKMIRRSRAPNRWWLCIIHCRSQNKKASQIACHLRGSALGPFFSASVLMKRCQATCNILDRLSSTQFPFRQCCRFGNPFSTMLSVITERGAIGSPFAIAIRTRMRGGMEEVFGTPFNDRDAQVPLFLNTGKELVYFTVNW